MNIKKGHFSKKLIAEKILPKIISQNYLAKIIAPSKDFMNLQISAKAK